MVNFRVSVPGYSVTAAAIGPTAAGLARPQIAEYNAPMGVLARMISINKYRLEKDDTGKYTVHSLEVTVCPICGREILIIGTRKRGIIADNGEKQTLVIRRLRCKECRKIHHELPDMVIPYKRHCAGTVERIVGGGDIGGMNCEESTIRRIRTWWATCRPYFENVLASLREKYGAVFSVGSAPREIVRAVVNAHLWVHTRSAFLPGP